MAKLKVFRATLGFFDTVVAAPSKIAALKAWGSRQDLFATGSAALAEDGAAVKAALAEPGVVLRRPVGSDEAFRKDAGVGGVKLPKVKKAEPAKTGAAAPPAKPKPPPDRSALTAAEMAVAGRQVRFAKDRDALDARRKALDEEMDRLREAFDADRSRLEAARAEAADAYRKAGG